MSDSEDDLSEYDYGSSLEDGHTTRISNRRLIAWLEERYLNALRIAETKSGQDRDGWIEDANYLNRALAAIEYLDALENS